MMMGSKVQTYHSSSRSKAVRLTFLNLNFEFWNSSCILTLVSASRWKRSDRRYYGIIVNIIAVVPYMKVSYHTSLLAVSRGPRHADKRICKAFTALSA